LEESNNSKVRLILCTLINIKELHIYTNGCQFSQYVSYKDVTRKARSVFYKYQAEFGCFFAELVSVISVSNKDFSTFGVLSW